MNNILLSIILFSFFSAPADSIAQQRKRKCGTHELYQKHIANNPGLLLKKLERDQFILEYSSLISNKTESAAVITIPVVVHIIHNGQAVGTGSNISDAQINSQIAVLNKDFRKLNSDVLPTSHPFRSVTADSEIEFCLAKQDPNGQATTGIKRYNYGKPTYLVDTIEDRIKPQTVWNSSKYLNIWVCRVDDSEDLLGYAQFPDETANTDGVVITDRAFGTSGTVLAPNHKGRTTTHEIGHWLNLYHIWGDDVCGDDEVADTEEAEQENYDCPVFPWNDYNTCGAGANGEMYMNFMDYTDDNCMNMFTTGQKNRMRAVLNSSRAGLLSSNGCQVPASISDLQNDAIAFDIFPNPTVAEFQIRFSKSLHEVVNISITNSLGQIVFEKNNLNTNHGSGTINTSSLSAGVYTLQLQAGNNRTNKKIIIHQ